MRVMMSLFLLYFVFIHFILIDSLTMKILLGLLVKIFTD